LSKAILLESLLFNSFSRSFKNSSWLSFDSDYCGLIFDVDAFLTKVLLLLGGLELLDI